VFLMSDVDEIAERNEGGNFPISVALFLMMMMLFLFVPLLFLFAFRLGFCGGLRMMSTMDLGQLEFSTT